MTNAQKAAREYMAGAELLAQIAELSDRSLARKFECSRRAICRAAHNLSTDALTADEQALVRACVQERQELERQSVGVGKQGVARRYGVSVAALNRELQVLGFVNPLTARKQFGGVA